MDGKQRHGCLTAWLVVMIIANSATALVYLVGSGLMARNLPQVPGWVFPFMGLMALFNLVCSIALLYWKKWGFYGFAVSAVTAFVINVLMVNIAGAVFGLLGLLALYGVLQIGAGNKGWPQLD